MKDMEGKNQFFDFYVIAVSLTEPDTDYTLIIIMEKVGSETWGYCGIGYVDELQTSPRNHLDLEQTLIFTAFSYMQRRANCSQIQIFDRHFMQNKTGFFSINPH